MDKIFGDKIITVELKDLPSNEELAGPEPDLDFVNSARSFGIIYPIVVTRVDGKMVLVDGRRRVKTARKLEQSTIKAIVYDNLSPDDTATWSLILNEQRSANVITEFQFYKQLMKNDRWVEMQKEYGFNKAHVEKILTLGNIHGLETLVTAYESGKISESTLFEIAKLGDSRQKYVLKVFKTKGKLSLSDIKEAQKVQHDEAIKTMPQFNAISEMPTIENTEPIQFAVSFPTSINVASLFATLQEAYEAKAQVSGARLYRLFEV